MFWVKFTQQMHMTDVTIFKKIEFLGLLGPPYCGIRATISICREMLCLPYAGFFFIKNQRKIGQIPMLPRTELGTIYKTASSLTGNTPRMRFQTSSRMEQAVNIGNKLFILIN